MGGALPGRPSGELAAHLDISGPEFDSRPCPTLLPGQYRELPRHQADLQRLVRVPIRLAALNSPRNAAVESARGMGCAWTSMTRTPQGTIEHL